MGNTQHILITATNTEKYLQSISVDIRLDFANNDFPTRNSVKCKNIADAIASIINNEMYTVPVVEYMTEQEYSQMINNGQ